MEPDSIAYPIRKILKYFPNFHFRLAEVNEIDTTKNKVRTNIGNLKFDYLVVASGSKSNYFGNTEIEKHSMAMKTIPQSLNLRSLVLENFEDALLTLEQNPTLTFTNGASNSILLRTPAQGLIGRVGSIVDKQICPVYVTICGWA